MKSKHNWLTVLLLAIFGGLFGVHRFAVGKVGTGFLWLVTAGMFGCGWIYDIVMIVCGKFEDKNELAIINESQWSKRIDDILQMQVFVRQSGKVYHNESCRDAYGASALTVRQVYELGLQPCTKCRPPYVR